MKILIASNNHRKVREIRTLLSLVPGVEVISLNHFSSYTPPEEIGITFEENAAIKAVDAVSRFHLPVMADDSGLVVPALQGAPGVRSARYAGIQATDAENRKKLLFEMQSLQGIDRNAYFECCIAFATPQEKPHYFQGRCWGMIALEEKGKNGFGYDSLFIKEGYSKTFGEIEEEVKNQISHRAKAMEKFLVFLKRYQNSCEKN